MLIFIISGCAKKNFCDEGNFLNYEEFVERFTFELKRFEKSYFVVKLNQRAAKCEQSSNVYDKLIEGVNIAQP